MLAGEVEVADIGIDVGPTGDRRSVDDRDVLDELPARQRHRHKWKAAVGVVAGSPGMEGAAVLSAHGAGRAGAGMVRLAVPGSAVAGGGTRPGPWPLEAVRTALPAEGWAGPAARALDRCRAAVVGPGLGRDPGTRAEVAFLLEALSVPVVVDADGLAALEGPEGVRRLVAGRADAVVLTPTTGSSPS